MNITEITVSASAKFPHPHEDYSNLTTGVTLKAQLGPEDQVGHAAADLQLLAQVLVSQQRQRVEAELGLAYKREHRAARLERLRENIEYDTRKIAEYRQKLLEEPCDYWQRCLDDRIQSRTRNEQTLGHLEATPVEDYDPYASEPPF